MDTQVAPSPSIESVEWRRALLRRSHKAIVKLDPLALIGVLLLGVLWFAVAKARADTTILPPPQNVLRRMVSSFTQAQGLTAYGLPAGLDGNLLFSVENVVIGIAIGTVVGTTLGLLSARSGVVRSITTPLLATVGTVPILIAIPFFLIWFGQGRVSGLLFVIVYSTGLIIVYSQRAANHLKPVYEAFARTLGADRRRLIRDVLLPGTLPEILGGMRIALAGAWGLEAIAELIALPKGIGKVIQAWTASVDVEGILAAVLWLGLAAVLVDFLMVAAIKYLCRWRAA